jgi:hypothetical protein
MINLEVLRLELNYLLQHVYTLFGDVASEEIKDAITYLIFSYLYPSSYDDTTVSNIQIIEEYLKKIQQTIEQPEYNILESNIITIRALMDKIKIEPANA